MSDARESPKLIVPAGTQVVTRVELRGRHGVADRPKGALGEVVKSPADDFHSYRVRFVDGEEVSLQRREFAVWREHQRAEATAGAALDDYDLREHVIYRCVVGSRAYGLDHPDSDTDRRGIYLPPADLHWSLYGVPEQLENDATQECYWELQKFLIMALAYHTDAYGRLVRELEDAREKTALPEQPTARAALDDLLARVRMAAR